MDLSLTSQPALSDLIVDKRQELTSITLGNGFSGVTEIQTGPDGLMYVLSLGGKISKKARPQYLNCHLQMDRLSVYFSCTLSVISLLAVFHLSNSSVLLIYAQNHNTTQMLSSNATSVHDEFGIIEIYPTKENGREWYLNMNDQLNDSLLSITFEPNITRQIDGSWRISETIVLSTSSPNPTPSTNSRDTLFI